MTFNFTVGDVTGHFAGPDVLKQVIDNEINGTILSTTSALNSPDT